ncbi:electron transfer flavoprotein subunit alpha/FixB family protein [Oceanirhabdus seepicola]|uniref:Electron transfer flavoprotein subunit alpha/FixB family protein n=1 Tax=Oceanirhabdus seepicola TaxID=2828781 RepID=A0A9J6NV19_9CLOT|nr:electron transfer flavoprotein subunit alpha/FixB family protein [Oceanirhabdus seepicola]MCM1988327.1 electron transfer flavoprotein subunit alpha/FixB family protein [Oceanirhabdus seepicola]
MAIGVFGEIVKGKLTKITLEALTKAMCLKQQMNIPIELILIGEEEEFSSIDYENCGSDSVILYKKSPTKDYITEECLATLVTYYEKYKPEIMIFTGGIRGIELAPRLAYRVNSKAMVDCTDIMYYKKSDEICITKPIYGSNVYGEFIAEYPLIIALRPHQYSIKIEKKTDISVINESVQELIETDWIMHKKLVQTTANELEDAKILVVCGRGVGGKQGIKKAEVIASELGGVIGGTKKVIDNGWLPIDKMIGQTGKIVSPELCIVIGASGATPFINGIQTSKKIIAINKDEDARVFEYADIGIIEDYNPILSLIEEILKSRA